jgi:hypothetical protein
MAADERLASARETVSLVSKINSRELGFYSSKAASPKVGLFATPVSKIPAAGTGRDLGFDYWLVDEEVVTLAFTCVTCLRRIV